MLGHLRVANLGVIEDASVEPSTGFTVITGETGAGKTLLLGGLRLLLGGPADTAAVGPYGDQAQIDGLVTFEEREVGATRIVPASGRSRAYMEGALVSAAALSEGLGSSVEIVGQHDQLTITRSAHVLAMVDGLLDEEGKHALEGYRAAWLSFQGARERQKKLGGDLTELVRELDLARYQEKEISAAGLSPGMDDDLEIELARLRNVDEIRLHLNEALESAMSGSEAVGAIVSGVRKAAALDASLGDIVNQSEILAEGLAELARGIRTADDGVTDDPARRDELEEWLTAIGDLKRKYGRTLEEVLEHGSRMAARASELAALLEDADEIDSHMARAQAQVEERANELKQSRERAANGMTERAAEHLADLGLDAALVEVGWEAVEPGPLGSDRADLLFASDRRLAPGRVSAVASGGELSRLILALRLAGRDRAVDTLVFDEVDTGIGGKTALAMGEKMSALAGDSQVLCVTHLAQVAAFADAHYVVERSAEGVAAVRKVEGPDRVEELSRMLAGQPDSASGQTAAADLLALAGK